MITEEYLDKRLAKMTRELIESIDLKIDMKLGPLSQMQEDIKLIKETLIELTVGVNSLKTDYRMLKEDQATMSVED